MKFLDYIKDRLQEASTWRGIILVLTSSGVAISPDLQDKIVAAGLGIAGLVGFFFPDK